MIKSVRGRDLNPECFYWKLRCQSVKLQDFWYNLLKYWRKLIISCTAYRAITQLILNNISILEFKSQENHHHCRSVFWICSLIAHIPFCHNLASFTLDDDKSNCNDFFFLFFSLTSIAMTRLTVQNGLFFLATDYLFCKISSYSNTPFIFPFSFVI